jgi:hypothetical protein
VRATQEAGIRFDGLMAQEKVTSRNSSDKAPKAAVAPLDADSEALALERVRGDLTGFDHARKKAGLEIACRD